ncbi:hypothetical protein CFP56_012243 [Quercus suber]|uniref:Uncharacterized protein n=1 Tax=Quercus suber TaxID=58331 RepID=A0AAW0M4N8_QUESU
MKDFNSHSKLQRRGLNKEKKIRDGFTKRKAEEQVPSIKVGASVNNRRNTAPKARAKLTKSDQGKPPQQFGRSRKDRATHSCPPTKPEIDQSIKGKQKD